ncbi:hypothetical protein ABTK13_24185, partial [Acinetobacter baumannii]
MVVAVVFTAGSRKAVYQVTVGGGNNTGTAAHWCTLPRYCPALLEQALVLGVLTGLVSGDQAALDQVLQV